MRKIASATLGSAALVRLGVPLIITVGVLLVIVIGAVCWTINDTDRSARTALLISTIRGPASRLSSGYVRAQLGRPVEDRGMESKQRNKAGSGGASSHY